ncbi:hypothetical protein NDU88_007426 [Pleurodeles waltl]|uniref:Uncharacterized protein n=1 Tax=Pleurodeles waltl TaxID=8319 RepID=A0AAV7PPW1_PLEWA|nr:hypothetical protein NDU88_007426 [Pleurodeles waltl]
MKEGPEKTEGHEGGMKEGPEKTEGRPTSREPRKPVVQGQIETGEEPEERELRQVPGGTWLNQSQPKAEAGDDGKLKRTAVAQLAGRQEYGAPHEGLVERAWMVRALSWNLTGIGRALLGAAGLQ